MLCFSVAVAAPEKRLIIMNNNNRCVVIIPYHRVKIQASTCKRAGPRKYTLIHVEPYRPPVNNSDNASDRRPRCPSRPKARCCPSFWSYREDGEGYDPASRGEVLLESYMGTPITARLRYAYPARVRIPKARPPRASEYPTVMICLKP